MANQKAVSMTIGTPGVELMILYNDANKKIGAVEWNISPPGIVCRARVWDSNVSPDVPVIDRTEGQGAGSQNVPGNYRMIEVTDSEGTYLDFPPNISFAFLIKTI